MCKKRQKTKKVKVYELTEGNEFFVDNNWFTVYKIYFNWIKKGATVIIEPGLTFTFDDRNQEVLIKDVH